MYLLPLYKNQFLNLYVRRWPDANSQYLEAHTPIFLLLPLSFSLSFYLFPLQSNHRNMICSHYWLILIPPRCLRCLRMAQSLVFALGKNRLACLYTRNTVFQIVACFALNTQLNLTNDICTYIYTHADHKSSSIQANWSQTIFLREQL